jgi:hypothetical protein
MNGKRVGVETGVQPHALNNGEYGRHYCSPSWYARTPNGHLANLSRHEVAEHDDGTITVAPSILISDGTGPVWHGYLERGVWREC